MDLFLCCRGQHTLEDLVSSGNIAALANLKDPTTIDSCLVLAAEYGQTAIICLLLPKSTAAQEAFYAAAAYGNEQSLLALLPNVEAGHNDNAAVRIAIRRGHLRILNHLKGLIDEDMFLFAVLINRTDVVRHLMRPEFHINILAHNCEAFRQAAYHGYAAIVKMLKYGADIAAILSARAIAGARRHTAVVTELAAYGP